MNRLKEEYKRLNNIPILELSDIDRYKEYCLSYFFEVSLENYNYFLEYCKNNNIKGVVDIGCCIGYQSELFLNNGIDYIGVDGTTNSFWNEDKANYITKEYPCEIKGYKDYLAISNLCLGWNCYLYNGIETLEGQFKQLAKDFDRSLIYMQKDNIEYIRKYFKEVNNLTGNFFELISKR